MSKKKDLLELLREVKNVLDEHDIKFWLECGTLLGAVRDGIFIPWEKDIDYSAWRHEVSDTTKNSIANSLRDKGFSVWVAESHMNIRKQGPCHADINFYEIHDDKAVMPAYMPKNIFGRILSIWLPSLMEPWHPRDIHKLSSKVKVFYIKSSVSISKIMPCFIRNGLVKVLSTIYKRFGAKDISWIVPMNYFADFSIMMFYDLEFLVPVNVDDYLEFRYGRDWRTPTQNWIHYEDDGACQEPAVNTNKAPINT